MEMIFLFLNYWLAEVNGEILNIQHSFTTNIT